jgi:hypothetical protein
MNKRTFAPRLGLRDDNRRVGKVVPAEGAILERVLDATYPFSNGGLSRHAYGKTLPRREPSGDAVIGDDSRWWMAATCSPAAVAESSRWTPTAINAERHGAELDAHLLRRCC